MALRGDESKAMIFSFEKTQTEIRQVIKDMNDAWVRACFC